MKIPLSYQITEYDCGPTSVMNAISYLFERKQVSPDIVKHIMMYCLDGYNEKGEAYKNGTTDTAIWFMSQWLNQFARARKFPIETETLSGADVNFGASSAITACIRQRGAAVVKVMLGGWHFVLVTDVDENYVYLFDPYYRQRPFTVEGIEKIDDAPCRMNRKVRKDYFSRIARDYYSLGTKDKRSAMLLYNTDTRAVAEAVKSAI